MDNINIDKFCKYAIKAFYTTVEVYKTIDINQFSGYLIETLAYEDITNIDKFLDSETSDFDSYNFKCLLEHMLSGEEND